METHDLNGEGTISQSEKMGSNHVWENQHRGIGSIVLLLLLLLLFLLL